LLAGPPLFLVLALGVHAALKPSFPPHALRCRPEQRNLPIVLQRRALPSRGRFGNELTFQILSVPSYPPDASDFPSGENANVNTVLE
jgi:hypothetical protein